VKARSTNEKTRSFCRSGTGTRKEKYIRESTGTTDRQKAERFLRDRLDARDEGRLSTVLDSKHLTFMQWADWFLERRSKPPFRSEGNHQQNLNAMKFLGPVFGEVALSDITAEAIEDYLAERLRSGRRVHTKFGLQTSGNRESRLPFIRSSEFSRTC
jgi:hypothetical protein